MRFLISKNTDLRRNTPDSNDYDIWFWAQFRHRSKLFSEFLVIRQSLAPRQWSIKQAFGTFFWWPWHRVEGKIPCFKCSHTKNAYAFRRATGDTSSDSVDTDFEADFPRGYMPRTRICEQPRIKQVTPFPIALTQKSKQISPALHTPARLCESTRIKLVTHKWGSKKDIETWHGHEQERQGSWSIWGHCQWLHFYANKSPQAANLLSFRGL